MISKNYILLIMFLYIFFGVLSLQANQITSKEIALKLNLNAGYKAIVQWKRVFKSERKMKRYRINLLTLDEKNRLEEYLVNHAIDSDSPTVAGRL